MLCDALPRLEAGEYPGGIWYYEPHTYQPYRYVLGRVGRRPLVCIGINPSTAQPGALDPTLKSVERLAAANGFDSWIMFNVYPQRATDPNDMDKTLDRALCDENLRWLRAVLAQTEPTMWAAWGTLIEKRAYLPGLMREMVALTRERDIPWVTFGPRSKKGHPHHPLLILGVLLSAAQRWVMTSSMRPYSLASCAERKLSRSVSSSTFSSGWPVYSLSSRFILARVRTR